MRGLHTDTKHCSASLVIITTISATLSLFLSVCLSLCVCVCVCVCASLSLSLTHTHTHTHNQTTLSPSNTCLPFAYNMSSSLPSDYNRSSSLPFAYNKSSSYTGVQEYRQLLTPVSCAASQTPRCLPPWATAAAGPVSYTHLTLPTIPRV